MSLDTAGPALDSIDLGDPELFRHGFPHDVFTVLRERAPIWRHPETRGATGPVRPFWVVSRHADVLAVSRDHEHFRSFEGPSIPDWDANARGMTHTHRSVGINNMITSSIKDLPVRLVPA